MFVRRKEYERLVREAGVSQERERLVQVLVEQVEYLRLQVGFATTTVSRSIATPDPTTPFIGPIVEQPWVGEEEEDLLAMHQAKVISDAEFNEAMQRVKARDHIIE